jgi:hypothetical protein
MALATGTIGWRRIIGVDRTLSRHEKFWSSDER